MVYQDMSIDEIKAKAYDVVRTSGSESEIRRRIYSLGVLTPVDAWFYERGHASVSFHGPDHKTFIYVHVK